MSRSNAIRPGVKQGELFVVDGHGNIVFDDIEEASMAYNNMLKLLYSNPRYFLDNLEHIKEFQVPWLNYSSKESCERLKRYYAISHPYNK